MNVGELIDALKNLPLEVTVLHHDGDMGDRPIHTIEEGLTACCYARVVVIS